VLGAAVRPLHGVEPEDGLVYRAEAPVHDPPIPECNHRIDQIRRLDAVPGRKEGSVELLAQVVRLGGAGDWVGCGGADFRLRGESLTGSTTILRERPRLVALIEALLLISNSV